MNYRNSLSRSISVSFHPPLASLVNDLPPQSGPCLHEMQRVHLSMSHTNDGIKRPENWQCMYNLSALNSYYILRKVESMRREILRAAAHEHPDVIDIQFDSDSVHFHCGARPRAASQHRPLHCPNRHEQGARSHTKQREKISIGVGKKKIKVFVVVVSFRGSRWPGKFVISPWHRVLGVQHRKPPEEKVFLFFLSPWASSSSLGKLFVVMILAATAGLLLDGATAPRRWII